jgi:FkbM family methyltransferase
MASPTDVITVELVDGTKVVLPDSLELITSYVLQEQGDWFEDEIKFLRQLIQPGDTVVDIGANYGVYALSLARKVGANGQVWAFEPASDTARLLSESASVNNTSWLQVVQQALSDREGTAWLQMPGQAELNSLADPSSLDAAAQQGSGESVAVTTLDRCLETYGWTGVDLLKIDAEGEEERILNGGKRFFREFSPLVMFEVKAGAELNLHLVECFQSLGYESFRLIPGLNTLVPFASEQGVDGFLLNLFAAKPDRVASLAEAGWLLEAVPPADGPETFDSGPALWPQALAGQPHGRRLQERWQRNAAAPEQAPIRAALDAWCRAHDAAAPIDRRYASLAHCLALLQDACQPGCNPGRWASLGLVALASGERLQAIHALNAFVTDLQAGRSVSLDEPFLLPDPAFEALDPTGPLDAWLEAAGLSAMEQIGSYSGFYSGRSSLPRLERLQELGYLTDPIQRRWHLIRQRFSLSVDVQAANTSVREWFDFLGLTEPVRCVDVGALALTDTAEPWVRWAHEGCAEVLGFEPLPDACDRLNRQASNSGAALRYLPWALGDGACHTLHVTNSPMTSSLYPPARTTVDLFPALGDLMQVVQEVPLQTHRLDDVAEAALTDFLKLDLQGAELMVLENAIDVLRNVSVIQCQVKFVQLYEGQPLMADVDSFLRSQGFGFLRFSSMKGRSFKPVHKVNDPFSPISQILWADAVYVRDFRAIEQWSIRQLQAAAFVLHEVYEAFDLTTLIFREIDRRRESDLVSIYLSVLMSFRDDCQVSSQ